MKHNYTFIDKLSKKVGDTFYIFDSELFINNYIRFRDTLRSYYLNSEIAYSYKANYMPAIGKILQKVDGMGEVVSRMEYDIAIKSISPDKIIFNGPVKNKEDIMYALQSGTFVNIDSFEQIKIIDEISNSFDSIDIGIRYNRKLNGIVSRFGFNYENGDLKNALGALAKNKKVRIAGLHSHYTTKEKSLELFKKRTEHAIEISKEFKLHDIKYINIGGGFFGEMPDSLKLQFGFNIPSFEEYCSCIGNIFSVEYGNNGPILILEPGISLIGNTMKLISRVVDIKNNYKKQLVLVDTNINVVNPTKSAIKNVVSVLHKSKSDHRPRQYSIVGNTCMEHDIIADECTGVISIGDFVIFPNRGAYSNNYTPPFIAPQPAIVDENGIVLKKADNADSVLSTYNY